MSSDQGKNEPHFEVNLEDNTTRDIYDHAPPVSSASRSRRRLLGVGVALVALTGFAGIAWYATHKGQQNPGAVVPVISADTQPVKVRPAEPGGLKVPNRGMKVFERMTPGAEPQKIERLLPPAEKPMGLPKTESEPALPSGPLVPQAPTIQARPTVPAVPPAVVATKTSELKAPKATPKAAAVTQTKAVALSKNVGGAWRVQLGAVRSEARAKTAVKRLVDANKDVLGSLKMEIVRADLGSRGVYFRMRAGPFADRTAASAACRKLAARKLSCIAVKP
ncbi:MAG: cell division septation protein DedD [Alphaproteobacteria bacterium]|jgi:cell division septation protein DedD